MSRYWFSDEQLKYADTSPAATHGEAPPRATALRGWWQGVVLPHALPTRTESAIMMIVTLVYLAFEVAFGARLLDVVSSTIDEEELKQIENAGRLISGIALTLVVWSFLVLPRMRRRGFPLATTVGALLASTLCACTASYWVQEGILTYISDSSTPEQRQAASSLTLVAATAQSGHLRLDGIDIDAIGPAAPEVKTLMSLLPALALSVNDLEQKVSDGLDEMIRYQIEDSIGNPRVFFEEHYAPVRKDLEDGYNAYLPIAEAHLERSRAMSGEITRQQAYWWKFYRNKILPRRYTPWSIPASEASYYRRLVQIQIAPVPNDWQPGDQEEFNRAVARKMMGQTALDFEAAMINRFGAPLPDTLDDRTFFEHPVIQQRWRALLGIPTEMKLNYGFSPAEVISEIYEPLVDYLHDDAKQAYLAPLVQFSNGGALEEKGISAMRVAYIPLLAFAFSILGAFVHLFKTAVFGLKAAAGLHTTKGKRIVTAGKVTLAVAVIGAGVWISAISNDVTRSPMFLSLEEQAARTVGRPFAQTIRIVIQMQPYVYPVADKVRHLLGGITFDFNPDTPTPAFEGFALTRSESHDV